MDVCDPGAGLLATTCPSVVSSSSSKISASGSSSLMAVRAPPSPPPIPRGGILRKQRASRHKTQPITFEEILEAEDEGASPLDEERAHRSFMKSLENLRRIATSSTNVSAPVHAGGLEGTEASTEGRDARGKPIPCTEL
ncbi:uncharacterized protein C11orf96 homolog [Petromyzon marinus]|uniref:Uncharacterized protein C11orf96 homolog n=1 Tax=Petromyzon marinus TaxID=7757 RepID=A0AAJ7TCH3_PETMA|nr:uncharacterized protein C11orf96 homolog [Petromyzon marinus]XP_032814144.1 uncharacterized protein C11orf96 homolog [Petromyzon marinus]